DEPDFDHALDTGLNTAILSAEPAPACSTAFPDRNQEIKSLKKGNFAYADVTVPFAAARPGGK
ncbi:MAG: hypothetical protein H8E32_10070, partial [Nitrospinae bacterium]|nr:hypothetical protein [Nitrospinota bacterium]